MEYCELSQKEQMRRCEIAENTRKILLAALPIHGQDELSLMTDYRGYYLQIAFSKLHPLMVLCLAKTLKKSVTPRQIRLANELNLRSILGSHAINYHVGCYSYRAVQWLDTELEAPRFFEMLDRCADEADRGYLVLTDVERSRKNRKATDIG